MEIESFAKYRIIYEPTGRIVYQMMINDIENDHHERLCRKMDQLSYQYGYEVKDMFYETVR